ncbi:nitrate reductase [Rheinheimera riviphila]|nr:nitrate reductase [Rheinheimera riviphila]
MANSTCPYCGVGCGVQVRLSGAGTATAASADAVLSGDPTHPANFGRLCVKGSALGSTLHSNNRLLQPNVHGQNCDWPTTIQSIAASLTKTIAEHGPGSVAMYLSGQLLTEDYYVANKLMKGFIGSSHVDTNSRLCMASTVAGHKRAFGADVVPGCYEDLELANLLVLVGANMAWNHPVLWQRIEAARERNPALKIVVIDPRITATAAAADLHLQLKPGTDTVLFHGLLAQLIRAQQLDSEFIRQHCQGFADLAADLAKQQLTLSAIAAGCDLPLSSVTQFYQWFGQEHNTVTLFSQGVNQATDGTDKVNAILNCHLATGRIGKPGASPFSLTGQPNAMGGREVGGLANQLAAHIDFTDPAKIALVQQFWQAPNIATKAGYKAVELFEAVARGEIKAIWIMATNPLVSMPDADAVKAALAACPLVIVSDIYQHTDTLDIAHIKLPALGWSEKDGTVTNSERRISRQQAFQPAPGQAKADWQIICEVAAAMGFAGQFTFANAAEIFAEHAALSAFHNDGNRAFDLSGLSTLSAAQYQNLAPTQWPVNAENPAGRQRLFADGRFYTPNGRANFIAIDVRALLQEKATIDSNKPWLLNSGRIRDQWHSMTRTGAVPALMQHRSEPFVVMHPADAAAEGLRDGQLVQLTNLLGAMRARLEISEAQRRGELFVPMHWTAQFSQQARCDVLFAANVDPVSGQPALKLSQVTLEAVPAGLALWLFCPQILSPQQLALLPLAYWARVPLNHCQVYRMVLPLQHKADLFQLRAELLQWLAQLPCSTTAAATATVESTDERAFDYRAAALSDNQLQWLLLCGADGIAPDEAWLDSCFAGALTVETRAVERRRQLLQGRPAEASTASGALICSCFQVRSSSIEQAIIAGAQCTKSLGEQLRCGTNCGSCLPEIRALLAKTGAKTAAKTVAATGTTPIQISEVA